MLFFCVVGDFDAGVDGIVCVAVSFFSITVFVLIVDVVLVFVSIFVFLFVVVSFFLLLLISFLLLCLLLVLL